MHSEGYSSCLVCMSVCYPYSGKLSNKASYQTFQQPLLDTIKKIINKNVTFRSYSGIYIAS